MRKLIFLLVTNGALWSGGEYVDFSRSFQLSVPRDYRARTGADKISKSYIPVCHAESAVCFEYPPRRYVGTTFGSASVEVILSGATTEKACMDPGGL